MEEKYEDTIKEHFYQMAPRKRLNIVRNGYALLEAIEQLEEDKVYARDLYFTNRTSSEIGLTLSAFEELYDEQLRAEINDTESIGNSYIWNIGRLRERKENNALKELLNW